MASSRRKAQADMTLALLHLGRVYRRVVNRHLAELSISDARALPVLHIARAGDGMRQHQLAELLGIEGPSLVRVLDQLCAAGLVERHLDPHDRRARTLHLTPRGRDLATMVENSLHKLRDRIFTGVPDADLASTLRTMNLLEHALVSDAPDHGGGHDGGHGPCYHGAEP